MGISTDQYKSVGNQSGSFPFVLYRTVQGLFRRVAGIFTLTDADRLKAGIYLGGEGRDG
jgi:hypothetical protein